MVESGKASPAVEILHVIAGLKASGAETALLRLVQRSPDHIVHTVVSLTDRGDLSDAFEAAGATVRAFGLSRGAAAPIAAARRLAELVPKTRPAVVQGWMVHGNIAAWALRLFCFPRARLAWNLRLTAADAVHEKMTTRLATRAAAWLSRSVDLLVSNSHAGLRDHRALGYRPRRSAVIPNGFNLTAFQRRPEDRERLRNQWELPEQAVVFALVGRFHIQKGQAAFVAAAEQVRDVRAEAVFLLAGRDADPQNEELRVMLGERNLASRFLLLGARRDVPAIMSAVDVLCMPSLYEGFPNVLGEAMASGLPCIATAVSDVGLILGNAGVLIDVGDTTGLANAMSKMVDLGPQGRSDLGARARRRIAESYSLETVTPLYWNLYDQLAACA
ncbi:MAG: glycosyltransferase [Brevundimonas sp.]|uniref:glycosyltransferase n=1 Tax=Brevundimonas sp. TaxID=1871086 RepID=UPI0027349C98|nr:glycosyltransferase [Brevundimonas sp.]MDP3655581.1 glycosyltransferase [Brevundimonas sp.]MDZ4110658.1 glycosyltransferase [Brevundimonas sp.]